MDGSEISTIIIKTNNDFSIKQWMINETNNTINNRYKQTHIADDIGVNGAQLSRFLKGNIVTDQFYDKWFKWYLTLGR
jgi:predicted XRE-type DNA-binding protein